MAGEVFFSNEKGKIAELVERVLDVDRGDVVAVKLHVGELGNKTHLGPEVAKVVVEKVREHGAEPFLTDSRTWYKGSRSNGRSHVQNALAHGFGRAGAPFKVADERGGVDYEASGILKTVELGALFEKANCLFAISHDKGHALAGFGGALKNLGMGCATPECKLAQHRTVGIEIDEGKCTGCGRCAEICEYAVVREGKRRDENEKCWRCLACGEECPQKAIRLVNQENLQRALASVSLAVKNLFKGRWGFLSAGINITQECDC
ncbi:MAG: DUF362 domain-containing protein, partial [Candidatus Micrarchaeota archaeon]